MVCAVAHAGEVVGVRVAVPVASQLRADGLEVEAVAALAELGWIVRLQLEDLAGTRASRRRAKRVGWTPLLGRTTFRTLQLLANLKIIPLGPMFHNLAVADTEDMDELPLNWSSLGLDPREDGQG